MNGTGIRYAQSDRVTTAMPINAPHIPLKAKADYEKAEKIGAEPYLFPVYFGLGEIAYRTKDIDGQKRNYKRYLELVPRGGVYENDYKTVKARYDQLMGAK